MKFLARASAVFALTALGFGIGAWWMHHTAARPADQASVTYACPMHPQYRSDHPGDCATCGMRLEVVRTNGSAGTSGTPPAPPMGAVRVTAERQQAVGVKLGVAEKISGGRTLRTTGRVVANETATYPLVAGVSGWIRSVADATTGSLVRKDEILASFYAPDFVVAQQSYYSGLETLDRSGNQQIQVYNQQRVVEGLQRFADTLRNLGVSETQLAEMRRKRELVQDVHIVSPIEGFVLQRNVTPGLRFDRGFELYRIADLKRVWILADVYQRQLRFIRPGMTTSVTSPQLDQPFSATVSRAEPIFDEDTLTLKVRLETANPRFVLKPGMFVDVEFAIDLPETLVVAADAIADSGLRKTVFVDRGNGYFEPREVETGWRIGDLVEVTKGVMPGERIVIAGTFLIDSEARMRPPPDAATAKDPICGMTVHVKEAAAAGLATRHDGTTYYFCAEVCRRRFDAGDRQKP